MITNPHMAVETTRELFSRLVSHGVDKEILIEKSGVDFDLLQKSERRFPVRSHLNLWNVADEYLSDKGVGLIMGSESDPSARGIVGLIFLSSQTLEQAVANKIRYTKILADHIDLTYHETDDSFVMTYSIVKDYFHCYEIERVFSAFFNWVRIFVAQNIYPVHLSFQYAEPDYIDCYRSYFQCPMSFGQTKNTIAFSKELLNYKNQRYNDYLYGILQSRAELVLATLDKTPDFLSNVRTTIAGRLCHGNFSADDLAATFNMSVRTFHRKLKEYDAMYQHILDDVRKEVVISYLRQNNNDYNSIAGLVGYSDSRSFQRAFKRWTGYSPKQYLNSKPMVPLNLVHKTHSEVKKISS